MAYINKQKCTHPHGDMVLDLAPWICGYCWAKLERRPVKYGPSHAGGAGPQSVTWVAEIRRADTGLTLEQFMRTMAKRYKMRSREPMTDHVAYSCAYDYLASLGDEFGDPAYDWSHQGARDMADDDMMDWEQGGMGGFSNS